MKLTDDIDCCEPFSSWGFVVGLRIYDEIKICFELSAKAEGYCAYCGKSYETLLDQAINRFTYNIRLLNKEINEGRCGPIVVYLEPN